MAEGGGASPSPATHAHGGGLQPNWPAEQMSIDDWKALQAQLRASRSYALQALAALQVEEQMLRAGCQVESDHEAVQLALATHFQRPAAEQVTAPLPFPAPASSDEDSDSDGGATPTPAAAQLMAMLEAELDSPLEGSDSDAASGSGP